MRKETPFFFSKGAFILGPRIDRFRGADSKYIGGHSIPLVTLGGFILVMGFMAFNGGSQGSISGEKDGEAVGKAIVATLVACSTSGLVVLFLNKFVGSGSWSLAKIVNGCLTGMVSVAGGCNDYAPWAACAVAAAAGPLYITISAAMVKFRCAMQR